ncbi:MAG: Ribosomal-protein-alanine acetyltransferase [candidate division TM6 bacterium GW2011_GWF2_32_72]|nr:MAG: Ribosomal-protein-alanine acetyltransferase [candidate division TM6 bacterium GW2011_GWF2_32_72]
MKKLYLSITIAIGLILTGYYFQDTLIKYNPFPPKNGICRYNKWVDEPFLYQIFKEEANLLFADPKAPHNFYPKQMLQYMSPIDNKKYYGQIQMRFIRENGKTVAFTVYYKKNFFKGQLLFLGVLDGYRKKGYATELIKYVMKDLERQGCTSIQWVTKVINTRAQNLYNKLGFKLLGVWDEHYHYEYTPKEHRK